MFKNKKILISLLAISLMMMLIVGCSPKDNGNGVVDSPDEELDEATDNEDEEDEEDE